jgi:hypothetical protein
LRCCGPPAVRRADTLALSATVISLARSPCDASASELDVQSFIELHYG